MKRIEEILRNPDSYRKIILNGIEYDYLITDEGHVISNNYHRSGYRKYLSEMSDADGYKRVILYKDGKLTIQQVHRLVALMFIPIPELYFNEGYSSRTLTVNHMDNNPSNNEVSNLEWATMKENIDYSWKCGRGPSFKLDKHPLAAYTNDQIHKVCRLFEENMRTMREISEETGVSYTVVKQIRNHIIWKEISDQYDIDSYTVDSRRQLPIIRAFTEQEEKYEKET